MTKYSFLLIAAIAILFSQCNDPGKGVGGNEHVKPALRPSIIYNIDSVKHYLSITAQYDTIALQELKQAQEVQALFPREAIHHLKRSITYRPTAEAYIRLGELLSGMEKFSEARDAYAVAAEVFSDDEGLDKKVFFNIIYTACMHPTSTTLYPFVDRAMERGIALEEIQDYLKGEPRLEAKRATREFEYILRYDLGPGVEGDSASFSNFLQAFERVELPMQSPFDIDMTDLTTNQDYMGGEEWWSFRPYIDETRYSGRMKFKPFKKLPDPAPGISAVIYSIDSSAYGARKDMWMIYYRLVTYDTKGEEVDNLVIAKHLGEEVCTASIVSENMIWLTVMERKWKKPFHYKDMDNEVTGLDPKGSLVVTIEKDGKINVADNDPAN